MFDVMVRITDEIFNTYIRKTGTVNPYYSEYYGKSVPGLKRTVTGQSRNALQILKYYYGDTEIIRTSNIQSIPRATPVRPSGRATAAQRCSPCSAS